MKPAGRKPALRALLCAAMLLLIGGCSTLRLGYGHIDSVATWMAHDYFDLEADQRDAFAQRFERLHAWHRHEQLPEYARFLADARTRAQRGLRADDLLWLLDGIKARYRLIAARSAPDAADLLATLSAAQIAHLRRELDQANRKFLREHRSGDGPAERRRAFDRRMLSQLRDWVGPLSDGQEQRVIALLQQVPLTDRLRHEDRLRRQREFLALLESRTGERRAFAQRVGDWLVHWETGRDPELARALDESWRKRAEFYAAVDRLLTAGQRAHLAHRLQDYIDDFRQLAERRPAVARAD